MPVQAKSALQMTQFDELRITIDDALGVALGLEAAHEGSEIALVIVKLEEAFMWAERVETRGRVPGDPAPAERRNVRTDPTDDRP